MWVSLKNNCDSVTVTGIGRRASSKTQKHNKIRYCHKSAVPLFYPQKQAISLN